MLAVTSMESYLWTGSSKKGWCRFWPSAPSASQLRRARLGLMLSMQYTTLARPGKPSSYMAGMAVGVVLEDGGDVAVDVADAHVHAAGHLVLDAAHELVGVGGLGVVGEDGRRPRRPDEVVGGAAGRHALGHGLGQAGVEVVGAADAGVGVQGAGGQVVGDLGVETAPARVELGLAVAREVVGGAEARAPVVAPGELAEAGVRPPSVPSSAVLTMPSGPRPLATAPTLASPSKQMPFRSGRWRASVSWRSQRMPGRVSFLPICQVSWANQLRYFWLVTTSGP